MEINVSRIELDFLCRTLLSSIERYCSNPENLKRFEEIKNSKEGREYLESLGLS